MEAMFSITRRAYRAGIFVLTTLILAFIINAATPPSSVSAAVCGSEPTSTTGKSTQQITVPATTTYTIWSRIKAPNTNPVEYTVYVDGQCFTIGQTAQTPGVLTWVDYENGSSLDKATVSLSAGTHTLVLTAGTEDLELDRVVLLSDSCAPTGTGDDCLNDTTQPNTSITSPTNGATVGGAVTITATATDNDEIDYVEFYRDGSTLLGSDNSSPYSYAWDTTSLSDGAYVVTTRAYDVSGNLRTSAQVNVTVNNAPPVDAAITSFSALPAAITNEPGETSQLSWSVAVGTDCSINQGIGAVGSTGTYDVSPVSTTTYTLTCDGQNGGAVDSEQVTVTVTPAPDTDGDNVKDHIEVAAPNSGDANADGTADWQQAHVTSFINSRTGDYNTLVAEGGCDVFGSVSSTGGKAAYSMGVTSFTLECTAAGQGAQVKLLLDREYDTSLWDIMKVNSALTTETDISRIVTVSSVDVAGESRTSLAYSLVDGGEHDEDGAANGLVVDPIAIVSSTPTVGAPNAGVGNRININSIVLAIGMTSLSFAAVWYLIIIRRAVAASRRK